jgi:hypothetical protein
MSKCIFNPEFTGVINIGSTKLLNELENNYKSFLDWGFIKIGGFTNVEIPTSNISSFNLHVLKPTADKNQSNNTVWQAPRKDWIYETGVSFSGQSPINISGVYINSNFYPAPTGNGTVGYKINYPEGKIIFNKAISPSSTVHLEYSYRNIQVYKTEEFPYWKEIQYRSLEDKTGILNSDKGNFSIGSEYRVQLPAIVIETIARSSHEPYQLASKDLIISQDLLLHVLADNPVDKNNIVDIIRIQKDRLIQLYKTDIVVKSGVYPLNYDGSKNINGQDYDIIVKNDAYKWKECFLKDVTISDINFTNMRMFGAVIRVTNEIICGSF